jgi:hypothetical protein
MRATSRFLSLVAAGTLSCSLGTAQSLAIGAIGGVRATGDLTGQGGTSESKRYVFGPEVDIGLPLGLGIEVDALYRREAYHSYYSNQFYNGTSDEHANSWEFPMLLKYRIPFPLIKPFLEAGYAPRVMNGSIHYYSNGSPVGTNYPTSQGVVVGGGVQFGIGRLRLSPAVRYTHWNNTPITVVFSDGPEFQSAQSQADIVLGISWKVH